jgi:8-oxo-dGTP pyrophosphatase MutT (NUDIX family)
MLLHYKNLQLSLLHRLPGIAAQMLMAPPVRKITQVPSSGARLGGVLILLYPKQEQWHVLLMKRTEDGSTHSGQISFPGGKYEAQDGSITYSAMREAHEEMGLVPGEYQILGNLSALYIPPSNFLVTPVLAIADLAPLLKHNLKEVESILEVPLRHLFADENKAAKEVMRSDDRTVAMQAPVYMLPSGAHIWGATAMILSELEVLIRSTE